MCKLIVIFILSLQPYFGGEARCDVELGEKYNPEELICGGCSDVSRAKVCQFYRGHYSNLPIRQNIILGFTILTISLTKKNLLYFLTKNIIFVEQFFEML
jgi:hypothetical protein